MTENLPWTPRVKQALAIAHKIARDNRLSYVGIEHVLLAALRNGDGPGYELLKKAGYDPSTLRDNFEATVLAVHCEEKPKVQTQTNDEVAALLRRAADLLSPQ